MADAKFSAYQILTDYSTRVAIDGQVVEFLVHDPTGTDEGLYRKHAMQLAKELERIAREIREEMARG